MGQLAEDLFNRADSLDMGANWTNGPSEGDFEIVSNEARPFTNNDSTNFYTAITWPENQYSEIEIGSVVGNTSTQGVGVACRGSTSARTHYRLVGNSTGYRLIRRVAGVATQLSANSTPTFATGDRLRLEVRTNGANADWIILKNGVLVTSGSDTSPITDAGNAGISFSGADSVQGTINSWSGGDFIYRRPMSLYYRTIGST